MIGQLAPQLRTVIQWLAANPQIATAIATTVAGLLGAGRHYRRHGSLPLQTLPWRAIRRIAYEVRKRAFSTPQPDASGLATVDTDLSTLSTGVGRQSYELNWPLSYRYRGEDLNARRYYYDPDRELPHRQLHIRAWTRDDGTTDIDAHEEPSALHHPRRHLASDDMTDATAWVADRHGNGNGLDPRGFEASS